MGGVFPGLGGMSAYLIEDGVRLPENRLVRKAQDDEALSAKPVVSRLILASRNIWAPPSASSTSLGEGQQQLAIQGPMGI